MIEFRNHITSWFQLVETRRAYELDFTRLPSTLISKLAMAPNAEEDRAYESDSSDESDQSPDELLSTPQRRTRRIPQNTPTVRTENSTKDVFLEQEAEKREERFWSETKNWCNGPMPPVLFLLKFLSSGRKRVNETPEQLQKRMSSKRGNHFRHVPAESFSKEEELYELIVRRPVSTRHDYHLIYILQCEGFNKSCRSFRLVDTHNNGESSGLGSLRPDLCLYYNDIADEMHIRGQDHRSSFGVTEAVVEVKRDETQDPFSDHPTSASDTAQSSFFAEFKGIGRSASAKRCVGQISTYVSQICARQHRTHCFTISIYGHFARFMRWDRAGVIVSGSFNYCNTQWLSEFARLFDKASDADRGYDMTIRTASPEEENIFRDVITKHVKSQVGPDSDMVQTFVEMLYEEDKVYKVSLHPEPRVPRPLTDRGAETGRDIRKY